MECPGFNSNPVPFGNDATFLKGFFPGLSPFPFYFYCTAAG